MDDPKLKAEVISVLRDLKGDRLTLVAVTHELGFAKRVADWVVVFDKGRVIEQGPPRQIFEAPLVADRLGRWGARTCTVGSEAGALGQPQQRHPYRAIVSHAQPRPAPTVRT